MLLMWMNLISMKMNKRWVLKKKHQQIHPLLEEHNLCLHSPTTNNHHLSPRAESSAPTRSTQRTFSTPPPNDNNKNERKRKREEINPRSIGILISSNRSPFNIITTNQKTWFMESNNNTNWTTNCQLGIQQKKKIES